MLRLTLAIVLVGCGGGSGGGMSDAKSEIECGMTWETDPPTAGTCDLACVEMTTGDGPECDTNIQASGGLVHCDSTFEVDGDRGCCFDLGLAGRVTGLGEPTRDRRVFFLSCAD